MNDFYQLLSTRRSIRAYKNQPLNQDVIEKLVRSGMQAPSAHNKQPWVFLTITDRALMAQIKPLCKWWKMLEQAGAVIITCMDTRGLGDDPREFFVASCCAATENMLLAAHAMGLGAVWLGVCPGTEFYDEFCRVISLPEGLEVVSMIAAGVPDEEKAGIDRFDPSKWKREHF